MFTTLGEWYKKTTRYFLYWRVLGSRLDRHFLSLAFSACCYFFSSFHFFPLILCFIGYPQFLNPSARGSIKMAFISHLHALASTIMSDSSSTYTATVLWYFEALLIGIILPQFEGRFKHFLLVIRIIHTSRSFLQKQHQQFFFWRAILVTYN